MVRRGFTLVELLIVAGVITVLMGVLLPALSGARESARSLKCANNIRTITQAWTMYADENSGRLPACGDGMTWPGTYSYLVYYL